MTSHAGNLSTAFYQGGISPVQIISLARLENKRPNFFRGHNLMQEGGGCYLTQAVLGVLADGVPISNRT
jgi:hypothetical protein